MPTAPSSDASAPRSEARPVEAGERLELLDALRGFALFGILISNVQMWFSGRVFPSREQFEASIASASLLDTITRYAFEVLSPGSSSPSSPSSSAWVSRCSSAGSRREVAASSRST